MALNEELLTYIKLKKKYGPKSKVKDEYNTTEDRSLKKSEDNKKYRSKRWVFNLHKPQEEEWLALKKILDSNVVQSAVVSFEHGATGNTPHIQGYLERHERIYGRKWLGNDRADIRAARGSTRACIRYTCGVDKEHELNNIMYLKKIEMPRDMIKPDVFILKDLYPFQRIIWNICNRNPHHRMIYWIFDESGSKGKTEIGRLLSYTRGAIILSGGREHIKHGIVNFMSHKHSKYPRIMIIDLAREDQSKISFAAIEDVKNRLFFSTRYDSKGVKGINNVHIIIFSNSKPAYYNNKQRLNFSLDRWCVLRIENKKLVLEYIHSDYKSDIDASNLDNDEIKHREIFWGYDFFIKDNFIKIDYVKVKTKKKTDAERLNGITIDEQPLMENKIKKEKII